MLTGFHFFPSNTLGFYLLTLNTKITTFTITIFKTINNYFLESFFVQIYNILKVEHIHKTKSSDFLEFFALVLFFLKFQCNWFKITFRICFIHKQRI